MKEIPVSEGVAEVVVREWTPGDLELIAKHSGPSGDVPWDPFVDAERLRQVPLEGLIVAEVDEEYAGFLYWFAGNRPWFDPGIGSFGHILEVQVLPEFQGQGVGKSLLRSALEQLWKEAVEVVYIDSTQDNEAARGLYESMGFEPFSHTIHYKIGIA